MIFRRDEGQRDWIDSELSKIHWPDSCVGRCCCWVMRKPLHVASYSRHLAFPWHASTIVSWRHPCLMAKHGLFTSTWDVLDCLQATGMVQQELQALEHFRRWVDRGGLVILSDTSFQTFNAFKGVLSSSCISRSWRFTGWNPKPQALWAFAMEHMWHFGLGNLWINLCLKSAKESPWKWKATDRPFLDPKNSFKGNPWSAQKQPQPPCSQLRLLL